MKKVNKESRKRHLDKMIREIEATNARIQEEIDATKARIEELKRQKVVVVSVHAMQA